ncbi:MAG: hypothetical protein L3J45_02060 [Flavobacteriaceae bacterium]|nr:hypothetical protein [Flavobacteriaceae bacterium]
MISYQDKLKEKHLPIINFFKEKGFGSSMPILNRFSYLKPIDRCIILEKLFVDGIRNIYLLDKLVLAYVKIGRQDLGMKVIDYARKTGESEVNCSGMEFKLDIGIPHKKTDSERLAKIKDKLSDTNDFMENKFLNLLKTFVTKPNKDYESNLSYYSSNEKMAIIKILFDMAAIDEKIDVREKNILKIIKDNFKTTTYDFNEACSMMPNVALDVIKKMNLTKKKQLVDLVTIMIAADEVVDQKEMNLFIALCQEANLPIPNQK